MTTDEAVFLMRYVQAVEQWDERRYLYEKVEAGEVLASKVRQFVEGEAEEGGWRAELTRLIGEGDE